jgi:glycosyltransferase involved in cell wall biosynthesis
MKILFHHRICSKDGQYVHIEEMIRFTGFVRDWHGLDKVISMIATDSPESGRHLLEVGDGPARAALEAQADALESRHRVSFAGVIGRDEVARYVAAFDIAMQPAVVEYASPLKLFALKLFEYLALGKAIIGPAQPNLMEILTDGQNAVLFDPKAVDGMAGAISKLTPDTALRQRVGKNARKTIDDKQLTWRENAARAVELFKRIPKHA